MPAGVQHLYPHRRPDHSTCTASVRDATVRTAFSIRESRQRSCGAELSGLSSVRAPSARDGYNELAPILAGAVEDLRISSVP